MCKYTHIYIVYMFIHVCIHMCMYAYVYIYKYVYLHIFKLSIILSIIQVESMNMKNQRTPGISAKNPHCIILCNLTETGIL